MTPEHHAAWTAEAVARLAADERVVGVVGMGSTGDHDRVDEWSDHDIAIVVAPGHATRYRGDTSWLPDRARVVAVAVEHHGGSRALYDDGHMVEWGVDTAEGLSGWLADDFAVLLDRGGVAAAMAAASARPYPATQPRPEADATLFLAAVLHAVARARRGELLAGGAVVHTDAVGALVRLLHTRFGGDRSRLDRLDGLRRIEQVYPAASGRIASALTQDVEAAARGLLEVARELIGVGPGGLDPATVAAVNRRLGWS